MSKQVESLVWQRSRAGKSDLLLLVKIADLCPQDDGLNCFAEVPYLAKQIRASERGTEYILRRLLDDGEIEIEYNDEGREIPLRGGRRFRPRWFIHVRCVCAWEAYGLETKPAKPAAFIATLRPGRSKRKPAKPADSSASGTRKDCSGNPKEPVEKPAKLGSVYKEGSVFDPEVEQEQGAAPPPTHSKPRGTDDDDPNFRVILKTAHDAIDIEGEAASFADLKDAVKSLCHLRNLNVGMTGELVAKAIDAALWQRQRLSTGTGGA